MPGIRKALPAPEKLQFGAEQWITPFIIIEISELLDAQEESGDEFRSEEGGPQGNALGP